MTASQLARLLALAPHVFPSVRVAGDWDALIRELQSQP